MKTDLEILKDVIDELEWESYIKSSDIGVSVNDGVVTLTGFVDSYSKKRLAESVVFRIEGVKAVAEDIIVRFDTDPKLTDTEIAQAILEAFKWKNNLRSDKIKVKVENGWVTTTGEVDFPFEKLAINEAIEHLAGVKGLDNLVKLNPNVKMNINDIKGKIMAAFHRNATIEANNITVTGFKNTVILRGVVQSNAEKQEAERVASNAPGVLVVDNRLLVVIPVLENSN